jgi:hypothetical protein
MKRLNAAAYYNMLLVQGLLSIQKKEFEAAIAFFTKASAKFPKNRDPYFYRAVAIIRCAIDKPVKPK